MAKKVIQNKRLLIIFLGCCLRIRAGWQGLLPVTQEHGVCRVRD